MERRMELNLLLDFYGPLLTESRARILQLYCEEDLSLQEIAEAQGVTRQAVHDAINRAQEQLDTYERKLGMIHRYRQIQIETANAIKQLKAVIPTEQTANALKMAMDTLNKIQWMEE